MESKPARIWPYVVGFITFSALWSMSIHWRERNKKDAASPVASATTSDSGQATWEAAWHRFFSYPHNSNIIKYEFLRKSFVERMERVTRAADQRGESLSSEQLLGFTRGEMVKDGLLSFHGKVVDQGLGSVEAGDLYRRGDQMSKSIPVDYNPFVIACKAGFQQVIQMQDGIQRSSCWKTCIEGYHVSVAGDTPCVRNNTEQKSSTSASYDPAWDALISRYFAQPRNARFAQYDWVVQQFQKNLQNLVNEAANQGFTYSDEELIETARELLVRDQWITNAGLVYARNGRTPNPWDKAPPIDSPGAPWNQYRQQGGATYTAYSPTNDEDAYREAMLKEQRQQTMEMQAQSRELEEQSRLLRRQEMREQYGF